MSAKSIALIAHNLRSTHNVGSILRTAEGLGINKVYLTGYTPYPAQEKDPRLPHLVQKIDKQINKTALGAQNMLAWESSHNIEIVIDRLRDEGYLIAGLEQTEQSVDILEYKRPNRIALIVGNELEGIERPVLQRCDVLLQIPMKGQKESFNVAQATAIALYQLNLVDQGK